MSGAHPLTQTRERIISNTMSVDEYFDELINQVVKNKIKKTLEK